MNQQAIEDRLLRFGRIINYMYKRGPAWGVFIGVEHPIPNMAVALSIDWRNSPSNTEILHDWGQVSRAPQGWRPALYGSLSKIRVDDLTIREMLEEDLGLMSRNLAVLIPEFGGYPASVQEGLMDMAFTLEGMGLGLRRYTALLEACRAGDWQKAALESRREDVDELRNAEVAVLFLKAHDFQKEAIGLKKNVV